MQSATILIVDDEKLIIDILMGMLEVDGEYRILSASNGVDALEIFDREQIDLVFTDLRMPEMDGMQLLFELRKRGSEVPVVIITAHGDKEDVIKALRLGASNFLLKPSDVKMVNAIAAKLLRVQKRNKLERAIYNHFIHETQKYVIPSELQYTAPLIDLLTEKIERIGICDQAGLMNMRIALDESLVNAIVHGNLEIESIEKGKTLRDLIKFNDLVKQKSKSEPYCNKKVYIEMELTPDKVEFTITDEGNGYDWENIPTSFDEIDLLSNHGRGLILIYAFMNEVRFNEKGNQIKMVKLRDEQPTFAHALSH